MQASRKITPARVALYRRYRRREFVRRDAASLAGITIAEAIRIDARGVKRSNRYSSRDRLAGQLARVPDWWTGDAASYERCVNANMGNVA